jgi:hypothetical protein
MNFSVNTLDDVAAKLDRSCLLLMYPGDVWNCEQGGVGESEVAKAKYRRDWSEIATQPLRSHGDMFDGEDPRCGESAY